METTLASPRKPRFRDSVLAVADATTAKVTLRTQHCSFDFSEQEAHGVSRLFADLRRGKLSVCELMERSPEIAEKVPPLLEEFNRLRLLVESDTELHEKVCSGRQLYREVRRVTDRTLARIAKSSFQRALVEDRATREQLIGYAFEYHWIVKAAPGLIGPALATTHAQKARILMQDFLRSELGHDHFLSSALAAVGVTDEEMELRQPLPATFAICAALGVYARQHPLSFYACLFLFEQAQPEFIDAFEDRCRDLGLPEAFYGPMRAHADINAEYNHEDISRSLMELESVVDSEACTVVKRHVSIMAETMIQQEEAILTFYSQERDHLFKLVDRHYSESTAEGAG
jgi:pyrroloquinoline quinone (PQQ) biosynthesis protein C